MSDEEPSGSAGDGSFEVLGEAATSAEPSECAFDQRLYNVAKNRSIWSVILVPLDHLVTERGI
jgi:hypothetical protein